MRYLRPEFLDPLAGAYVLGTLSGRARRRFARLMRRHAAVTQAVRTWEERLTPLTAAVPSVAPPARIWRAIHAQLEQTAPTPSGITEWLARFASAARPVRWALAAQAVAIAGLTATLVVTQLSEPRFETFSTPAPAASATAGHLRLVFAETIAEKDMRQLLWSIGGTLVQGPDNAGVYTIALQDPATLASVLEKLERHSGVKWAQPAARAAGPDR